jgi:hypothetical protein
MVSNANNGQNIVKYEGSKKVQRSLTLMSFNISSSVNIPVHHKYTIIFNPEVHEHPIKCGW